LPVETTGPAGRAKARGSVPVSDGVVCEDSGGAAAGSSTHDSDRASLFGLRNDPPPGSVAIYRPLV